MATFIIISLNPQNENLSNAIAQAYPDNFFKISSDQWAVSTESLTKEVADKLNITNGNHGMVAIFKIDAYYGWHNSSLWEWLDLKSKK